MEGHFLESLMSISDEEDELEDIDDLHFYLESSSSEEDSSDEEETDEPIAFKKQKTSENRSWIDTPFSPTVFDFDPSKSGINPDINLDENSEEIDFFQQYFNESIMETIVTETNKYASVLLTMTSRASKFANWFDTTVEEMYIFLGTIILMGLVGKNSLKKYWSNNPIINTPFFKVLFSQNRFLNLVRALHFHDNNQLPTDNRPDRLKKIRNILDSLRNIFKNKFYPYQNLCIDENMFPGKGKLSFKIYIPAEKQKFGIKLFVCCDVQTGYALDLFVYTGSNCDVETKENGGIAGLVVTKMIHDYLGRGHKLFLKKWNTSPALFDYLFENKTNACGMVRANQRGMPIFSKLKKGEAKGVHSNGLSVLKWRDKRNVLILTNCHKNEMVNRGKADLVTGQVKDKPAAVVDYSINMGTVGRIDQHLGFVDTTRRTFKWYKKIFFRLLDVSVMNAHILFQIKTCKKISFDDFRENLATQIVERYHTNRESTTFGKKVDCPVRLTEKHFIDLIPHPAKNGKSTRRRCHVCFNSVVRNKRRKETRYMCQKCNVSLCLTPCFEEYHTLKYY